MKTSTKLFLTGIAPLIVLLLIILSGTILAVTANGESVKDITTPPRDTIRIETVKTIHDTVWIKCNRPHVQPQVQPVKVDTQVLQSDTETVN